MLFTIAGVTMPATDRPRKTSAPAMASAKRARNIARIGRPGDLLLGRVEVGPAGVDHSPAVAEYGVLYPEAVEKFGNGDARRASSAHGHAHMGKALAHYLEGIDECGQGDHGGAVLVIVKDGYHSGSS